MRERRFKLGPKQEVVFSIKKQLDTIKAFAGMGMTLEETTLAFNIAKRANVSSRQIEIALTQATDRRPPKDRNSHPPNLDKVLKLLIARETIMTADNVTKPREASEWQKVAEAMGDIEQPLSIVKHLLRRGESLREAMQIARLERQPTKNPIVWFAQELAGAGMIDNDSSDWLELGEICNDKGIKLPHIAYRVVLEAFLSAHKGIRTQNLTSINNYIQLRGRCIDEESKKSSELTRLEDAIGSADDDLKYRVDAVGLYRRGSDGAKLRVPVGVSDKGIVVVDNPFLLGQREASRNRIAASRLEGGKTKATRAEILWEIEHAT